MPRQWSPKLFSLPLSAASAGGGPIRYYLPYCLMVPGAGGCTDGFGNPQNGYAEPKYDTLIGIFNPSTTTTMTAIVRTFNADGTVAAWQSTQTKTITLAAGHSVAFSFIVDNIYADVPQNFTGYAIIDLSLPGGVTVALGGGGCYPAYYNSLSAEIYPYADSAQIAGIRVATSRSTFNYAYTIPYFDDLNHHLTHSYRTGLTLTNFDTQACYAFLTYTVSDGYVGLAGTSYTYTTAQIAGGTSLSLDLATVLNTVGFPLDETASEGSLTINLRATTSGSDPLVNRLMIPYVLVQSQGIGTGVSNQFAFGCEFF